MSFLPLIDKCQQEIIKLFDYIQFMFDTFKVTKCWHLLIIRVSPLRIVVPLWFVKGVNDTNRVGKAIQ